jgi:ribosomal protein S18 acetylase RimI-like enzyme
VCGFDEGGMSDLDLSWAESVEERREAARFLAASIKDDPAYISHGEVQQALSRDAKSWAPDLEARLVRELEGAVAGRGVALARRGGELVGIASASWETKAPTPHAVLADLAVRPDIRDQGVGLALVKFVEAEAAKRGLKWMFLESGLKNRRAHAFFEREGFNVLSKVFVKRL